jgi:hypothetical protein
VTVGGIRDIRARKPQSRSRLEESLQPLALEQAARGDFPRDHDQDPESFENAPDACAVLACVRDLDGGVRRSGAGGGFRVGFGQLERLVPAFGEAHDDLCVPPVDFRHRSLADPGTRISVGIDFVGRAARGASFLLDCDGRAFPQVSQRIAVMSAGDDQIFGELVGVLDPVGDRDQHGVRAAIERVARPLGRHRRMDGRRGLCAERRRQQRAGDRGECKSLHRSLSRACRPC